VPLSVDVCVVTPVALTEIVAFRTTPAARAVVGRNCTDTWQVAVGANVVMPTALPGWTGPQVVAFWTMKNSVGLVPPSVPSPTPVKFTFPVLVYVNTCVGPVVEPRATVP